jgi:DNA repair protein SbcD/Mre11
LLIAHLADLHLGYRAYHRVDATGMNVRESDVARAFAEATDRVVAARPDVVLVAGDVFHTVRPSNAAIAEAFRRFSALAARLPGVPVVVIAGNHDSPRSADTGHILALFREIPGLQVVTDDATRVPLPGLDASVLCVPHAELARDPGQGAEGELGGARARSFEPDPGAATNVLVLHATVTGPTAGRRLHWVSEFGGVTVDEAEIDAARWDYVALGHYHIATELAPNMWYAGATERTSSNLWMEAEGEKGFVLFDTSTGVARFEPLPTRPVVDLTRVAARGRDVAELDAALLAAVESIPDGLDGKIVRLVVSDIPRHVVRELNHRRIRDWRAAAVHFHLDLRPPEVRRAGAFAGRGRATLRAEVDAFLAEQWEPSATSIRRERLVELSGTYLDAAGEEG